MAAFCFSSVNNEKPHFITHPIKIHPLNNYFNIIIFRDFDLKNKINLIKILIFFSYIVGVTSLK